MMFPMEASAADAQKTIVEEFAFFNDWSERYQYLIDLGKKLPDLKTEWKTEEHRLTGCQSMVWIVPEGNKDKLDFNAISDSTIVSGLIFLALRVYSGRSAEEIMNTAPDYISQIGLAKHLSPTRSNGMKSLLQFIQQTAHSALSARNTA
jgi:cysteine desulfuration protein SufE